jgi:hypothetical protein
MSATDSFDFTFQRLREARLALLRFHKALLDSERASYEQVHGRIQSNGDFFRLVIDHEWFSWLRPMSQFIAQVDEAFAAKEPMTLSQARELLTQARTLLKPSAEGTIAEQRYYQAIQRDADIAFMHAEISKMLAKREL